MFDWANPWSIAAKILGPIALIAALIWGYNNRIDAAFDRGADSRDLEVTELVGDLKTANADIDTLTGDLTRCRKSNTQLEADKSSLNSRIIASAEESAKALTDQAQQFANTQAVTGKAMDTLARNTQAADIDFAAILEQLKGVSYDVDENTGRCVIRGGGRILSNAAKGKTGN